MWNGWRQAVIELRDSSQECVDQLEENDKVLAADIRKLKAENRDLRSRVEYLERLSRAPRARA